MQIRPKLHVVASSRFVTCGPLRFVENVDVEATCSVAKRRPRESALRRDKQSDLATSKRTGLTHSHQGRVSQNPYEAVERVKPNANLSQIMCAYLATDQGRGHLRLEKISFVCYTYNIARTERHAAWQYVKDCFASFPPVKIIRKPCRLDVARSLER